MFFFCLFVCLCDSSPGGLAEERGRHRSIAGLQLSDHHRSRPDHQTGAALGHGQLHLCGSQRRGQETQQHGYAHRLR